MATGKCKDCRFGFFPANAAGSREWQGKCLSDILSKDDGENMKYRTIMQHFSCSNNKFEPCGK